uniref:Testis cDNA clone: QtsA-19009, similar to human zinc finger protein 91 homolog (mouse) (ZFP91),transcript variant 1 n=1 Tax=Macaca fascicularis TaxID=9541 RepID=Q4R376_MACFA|nr:unnamed protein product [Macaca fascicularis]
MNLQKSCPTLRSLLYFLTSYHLYSTLRFFVTLILCFHKFHLQWLVIRYFSLLHKSKLHF